MLKEMCQEKPKDWDRYLSAVLFVYTEVPQATTGFSQFELLYAITVRGLMQVLKELWNAKETPEVPNTYQYVSDLRLAFKHQHISTENSMSIEIF